jgi:O-acetyl-ADP-ribose deacetylase (regulator of RNase III)
LPPRIGFVRWRCISTGIYRFPPDRAARIAVGTVAAELAAAPRGIEQVVLCCFAAPSAEHHIAALTDLGLA